MRYLSGYTDRLKLLLAEAEIELSVEAYEESVQAAVSHYSRLYPRRRAVDYSGNGSSYTFTLPTDFDTTAVVTKIEYPHGEQTPEYLASSEYTVYEDLDVNGLSVLKLRLFVIPASTEKLRMYYSTSHTLSETVDTIPDLHFRPITHLAAYYLCMALAGHFAFTTNDSLQTAVVIYRGKKEQFESLSMRYLDMFRLEIGLSKSGTGASAAGVRFTSQRSDTIFPH